MKIDEVLTRGVERIYPDKKALEKLLTSKKITLYQGFDPTMPSLHLGHYAGLMKLRQFQKLGHKIIFLIGDFTGMIGDPTDKTQTRKQLTRKEVLQNSKDFKNQAGRIIDFEGTNRAEVLYNSQWNDKLSFEEILSLTSKFTYQQLIERDMFQERIKKGEPIYIHELLYPVVQAYDSLYMKVDLEIGGNDQTFNMLTGRTLVKAVEGREKYVLTTKLLVDKDANKVGKTTGNALFLNKSPEEFFGGIMAFPDEVIKLGFELLTEVSLDDLEDCIKKDPMGEKKHLAHEVVKIIWDEESANKSQANFENTFQKQNVPQNMKVIKTNDTSLPILDLIFMTKNLSSRSEAKRLIAQNAVEVDGAIINNPSEVIGIKKEGIVVKIGKKIFFKFVANRN